MKTEVQKTECRELTDTECRELTDHELNSVSGGGFWSDVLDVVVFGPILAPKPAH
jgi:bacteriocin-like protein